MALRGVEHGADTIFIEYLRQFCGIELHGTVGNILGAHEAHLDLTHLADLVFERHAGHYFLHLRLDIGVDGDGRSVRTLLLRAAGKHQGHCGKPYFLHGA